MEQQDFSLTLTTHRSPDDVYNAINDVRGWWSQDFKGSSMAVGDEFEVHFNDVHHSYHRVTELIPGEKVAWQVTDSRLNFLKNKEEWNGTQNIFEISRVGDETQILFTHPGLVPQIECFGACSGGWTHFLRNSLLPFINTGQGKPQLVAAIKEP